MARPRDRFDLDLIAKRLSKTVRTNDQGEHVFSQPSGVFVLEELASVLDTALEFSPEFPLCERHRSIKKAMLAASGAGPASGKTLVAAVSRREQAYLRSKSKDFTIMVSLSMALSQDGVRWLSFRGSQFLLSRPADPPRQRRKPAPKLWRGRRGQFAGG